MIPKSYLQTDPKWKNRAYGNSTIGKGGCGPTCAAMVLAALKSASITPVTTAAWAASNGYRADGYGTYYSYFKAIGKKYGIRIAQMNGSNLRDLPAAKAKPYHKAMLEELAEGNWIIACMGKGDWTSAGHFIVVYKAAKGTLYILDPNSTAKRRLVSSVARLQSQAKYYFSVDVPAKKTAQKKV
jgi:hypothetical protein